MNTKPETLHITAIYKQRVGNGTFAAHFDIPAFKTNGVDCDTPENEAVLVNGLRRKLIQQAKAFHVAGGVPQPPSDKQFYEGTRVLAFYEEHRAKALLERFDAPIIL